jgi:shikimate dehydrogenase
MKRLAVLGHPVEHSRSPAMQTAALADLGLGEEWSYEAIDMAPADFARSTRALPSEGFVGANVTIPHKEAALALAGEASAAATEIGAANTLTFSVGGIRADNTDAAGLLAALDRSPAGMRALVLGAGGSARAVAWALVGAGAGVEVWNRTAARADELVRDLAAAEAEARKDAPMLAAIATDQAHAETFDLIVNCTAIGMPGAGPDDPFKELPIDSERFDGGVVLVDLVYGGEETRLAHEAREHGAEVIDGLEVLVRQGAESLRIWTGLDPPLDVMRQAARLG